MYHPIDSLAPRLLQQSGLFLDLIADNQAEDGQDVPAYAAAANHYSEPLTFYFAHPVPGQVSGRDGNHARDTSVHVTVARYIPTRRSAGSTAPATASQMHGAGQLPTPPAAQATGAAATASVDARR